MNERMSPPLTRPNQSEVSNVRLRIAEATQMARLLAIDFRATLTRAAFVAATVVRRMHGEPIPIDWDPDLEDVDQDLAAREHEETEKLRAIYKEMTRRRILRKQRHTG